MRQVFRVFCAVAACALIAYGIIQPVAQDTRWLLALWLSAPLLLVAARLSLPSASRGISRSVQNLGVVISLGFVLLSLQLLRQQFVRANDIYNYNYQDPITGQNVSNVRPVLQSQRVQRGKMFDRRGELLVDSKIITGNYALRTYPLANKYDPEAFSSITGYFSNRFGQTGLEASYSNYLNGEDDDYGQLKNTLLGNAQIGDDLHLTIDAGLQQAAFAALGGKHGSVVVLDPKTGAVLAMVSAPGFDPRGLAFDEGAPDRDVENDRISAYWRALNGEGAGQPLINRPTQGRYPPGSIFKTITAVSALENPNEARPDQIDCPDQRFTAEGAPPVVNAVRTGLEGLIRSTPSAGVPNLERVYAFSCNTAFAEYAMRLGQDKLAATAQQFDFFRPQDAPLKYDGFTDLPTDPSLLYTEPGFLNSTAALADTGYGQGQLFVTPLQMVMAASAIANKDGQIMQPYLVERITRPTGELVVAHGPRVLKQVLSAQNAAKMRENMRAVVAYGFGKPAQQVDRSIAVVGGKSGTAEHGPGTTPHAWFIAIAPVDNPRYAVVAMVEDGGEGSSVGAKVAGDVLAAAFNLEQ